MRRATIAALSIVVGRVIVIPTPEDLDSLESYVDELVQAEPVKTPGARP